MQPYPKKDFANEVSQLAVRDEQDLLRFLPWAARLAALGDERQLARWPGLARQVRADLARLLADRCEEGIWDLRYAIGEDLGLAVIDAQDFYCFYQLQHDLLPKAGRAHLKAWFEEANDTSLDEEAVETLEIFIEKFPIREELRLAIVAAPMGSFTWAVLASRAKPCRVVDAEWGLPAWMHAETEEDVPLALIPCGDSGAPTEGHMRRMHREAMAEVPGVGPIRVTRQLDPDWRVLLSVEHMGATREEKSVPVRSIRLGLFPASPVAEDQTAEWLADLRHFALQQKLDILGAPVAVRLDNGVLLSIVDS